MMKFGILFLLVCISCIMCFSQEQTYSPVWQGEGRIAISSDGNEHDDDDWSATPLSLAMLAARGLQDKLVLYTFSDHIWGSSQRYPDKHGMSAYEHMQESALGAKEKFEFNKSKFVCAVDNPEIAYNAMRDEINKSTVDNPLFIIAAGPMQVVGEALVRSNPECLKYVTLISHSLWNENHADENHAIRDHNVKEWDHHQGWTWEEMIQRFGNKTENEYANFIHIEDQNRGKDKIGLRCDYHLFDWMLTSGAKDLPVYKKGSWDWLYTRLESAKKGNNPRVFDVSDAGMVVFLLTGNQKVDPYHVRQILENPK